MIPNMIPVIEEQLREKDKEIERLKSRLEEYQEYVEINHKEIERLKKREQECIDHYLVQCRYASEMEDKYISANNIIKEAREYIKRKDICIDTRKTDGSMGYVDLEKELLEILDKENNNE